VVVTGREIVIVTEEKETVAIADAVTEAVKVGVGVLLLTSVPLSAQREREVKAKAPLINFRCSYPAFVKISAIGRFPNKKSTLFRLIVVLYIVFFQ
jgi:hypothetical protein